MASTQEVESKKRRATLSLALSAALSLISSSALATISLSPTGQSNTANPNGTNTPIIYFSNIGASDAAPNPSYQQADTNNSCVASPTACNTTANPNCRNRDNSLSIVVNSNTTNNGGQMYMVVGPATNFSSSISGTQKLDNQAYTTGTNATFTIPFQNICTAAAAMTTGAPVTNCSCVPTSGTTAQITLTAILDADNSGSYGSGDDTASITLTIQNSMPLYSDSTQSPAQGMYEFKASAGDEKVRFKNSSIAAETSYPTTLNSIGIEYVRFYYVSYPDDTCDESRFASLPTTPPAKCDASTNCAYTTVDPTTGNLNQNYADNLVNNMYYYFRIALVDYAGNIGYYTKPGLASASAGDDSCDHAAKPDQVVGLLSQNGCFIATAAYGSPLEPHLKTLRSFRDHILLKSESGKKFVRWYYKHSPSWAMRIEKSDAKRKVARAFLYPVVAFASLALKWGTATAFMFMLLLLMQPLLWYRYFTRPKLQSFKKSGVISLSTFFFSLIVLSSLLILVAPLGAHAEEGENLFDENPAATDAEKDLVKPAAEGETNQDLAITSNPQAQPGKKDTQDTFSKDNGDASHTRLVPFYTEKREKPVLQKITKKGEFVYKQKPSPQHHAAGFSVGPYAPKNLQADSAAIGYKEIYHNQNGIIVDFSYEYQFFKSAGKIGLRGDVGFFTVTGNGRFLHSPSVEADETVQLVVFPMAISAIYRAQFWDRQPVAPFGAIGLDAFPFIEYRADKKKIDQAIKYSGAGGWHWMAGAQIQLDALDKEGLWRMDSEYGINHILLVGDVRQIVGVGKFDFSAMIFEGGVTFEF